MITKHNILDKADQWLLGAYIAAMPLPYRYANLILIPIILYWLITHKYKTSMDVLKQSSDFKLFAVLFGIIFLSIVTSDNFSFRLSEIERYLYLLFIPVIFSGFKISSNELNKLLLFFFVSSCSLCAIYSLVSTFIVYDLSLHDIFSSKEAFSYFTWILPETLNLKSNYYSLYIAFCLIILGEHILENRTRKDQLLLLFLFSFLFVFLGLLSSRTSFFAVIFSFAFYLGRLIFKSKFKIRKVVAISAVLIILVMLSLQFPFLNSKIAGVLKAGTPTDARYLLFQCGWQIFSEHPLWGVGICDVEKIAISCYETVGHAEAIENKYNFHNAFLELGASTGIFGVLAFAALMISMFVKAIKTNKMTCIGFAFIFFLASLTESTLTRNKGLIFFSTFSTLLFILRPYEENTSR